MSLLQYRTYVNVEYSGRSLPDKGCTIELRLENFLARKISERLKYDEILFFVKG